MDSSVHLIYHGRSDLGSLILIRINPKDRTLGFLRQSCILDFTPCIRNSRYWILDSLTVDSGVQSLGGFRIPWSVFWIPKLRAPDSTRKISRIPQEKFPGFHKKNYPDSGIRIPLQGANQRFVWLPMIIRDFKIQWRGRQRERQKTNGFYKQNNSFARASHFFVHFFSHFCTTSTWKCRISRFMENVNKQLRNLISPSELGYGLKEFNFRRVCLTLTK